jgi:hypothetical protein
VPAAPINAAPRSTAVICFRMMRCSPFFSFYVEATRSDRKRFVTAIFLANEILAGTKCNGTTMLIVS